jgi:phosphoglycerate dehydrogenase-like enzyme
MLPRQNGQRRRRAERARTVRPIAAEESRLPGLPPLLVFSPEAAQAQHYLELLHRDRPALRVAAASTLADALIAGAEAEILLGWRFPAGLVEAMPKLRWVHKISAGVEDLVLGGGLPPGVRLTRSDGAAIAPRMVEYVLGAIYMKTQRFERAWRQQARRHWELYMIDLAAGRKTVGVAGLGDIGGTIARSLTANGMRVVGWRRAPVAAEGVERVYAGREELADFVAECDFVVAVLPTTLETAGVFSAEVFAAMRPEAVFINIGRGASVDEAALIEALETGRIAGAVLDVFAEEPLPPDSPLWGMQQVTITPHVSGPLIAEDVLPLFLQNLRRYAAGEPLLREVDLERGY